MRERELAREIARQAKAVEAARIRAEGARLDALHLERQEAARVRKLGHMLVRPLVCVRACACVQLFVCMCVWSVLD